MNHKHNSHEFYGFFLHNPFPSFVIQLEDFTFIDVNNAALRMYGYTREEFLNMTLTQLHPNLTQTDLKEKYAAALHQKGNVTFGIVSHTTKNGTLHPMKAHGFYCEMNDQPCLVLTCQEVSPIGHGYSDAQLLLDASLDVICATNEQGKFEYVSAAAHKHWGYFPDELIGKPYEDYILEDDLPKTREIAAKILDGHEVSTFINRYKKKGGGIAYNSWSARWDNNTKLMYCVARNAELKIEENERILQSEQRFKALVQEGSDLIGILDAEGIYSYVSPTSTSILGMAPEEFIGRSPFDFIHPEDAEKTLASLQKISIENKVIVAPFRFQNHKKEWRWIETILTNMLDNPAVGGIVANSRDITDKIEEEHRFKLLESVITNTNDAVMITEAEPFDEPGPRIIFVNEAFTKMTGYEAHEVIGKSPRILQGPNSNKEELAKLSESLRNWKSCEITTINYKKNGEEFWINFTVTPVANEKGWYTHWIAIERDVTEQKHKELEKELLAQISLNFNLEQDYLSAAHELCKSIRLFGNFDLVELWAPNLEKTQMQLLNHVVQHEKDKKFYTHSRNITSFEKSVGLAGKVWDNRKQLLWDGIDNSKDFVRADAAKKIGLKSVLGIPLIFNDEVLGVLMIGTKFKASYLKKYAGIFQQLEAFIGSELNRKKLEEDLKHLFDAIPDILCLGDFNGRFLKINKAGCDLLGYTEDEILYHSFDEFIHPEDKDISYNELKRLEEGETTFRFETRFITKKGEIIWLSWYCNSSVKEGLIYSTAKNITEEKKLRELNRQAGKMAKIGSWEVDLIKNNLYWSEEVHALHETDPTTYTPDVASAIEFYREDFREIVKSKVEESILTGKTVDFEAVIVTTQKKEIWVRSIGNTEFINGQAIRFYGSFQNIDDLKQTEFRLRSLADNLPGVVFQYLLRPDGKDALKYVTKGAQSVWGYSSEEVIHNNNLVWEGISAAGELEKVLKSISDSVETKTKWTAKWKYVIPNGGIRTHLGFGSPIFLVDGTVLFNSVVLDITQEAKNEELIEQVSKMAKIGSWELNLIGEENDRMYWSPIIKEILEIDANYNPNITGGIEFFSDESKERILEATENLIKKGIPFDEVLLLQTQKGNDQWVRLIGKSERVNNWCTKIYGSFQDIQLHKTLELQIKEILGSISDAFYAVDANWHITYFNKEAERLFKRNAIDLIGKNIWEELPALKDTLLKSTYQKVSKNKKATNIEYFSPQDDKWFEVSVYPSKDGLSVYFKDITLRKEADIRVLQANERYEKATEATNDVIWDWDIENKTYYRSKAIENFFGKHALKLKTEKNYWQDTFHPDDIAKMQESIKEAIADPTRNHLELEYRIFNEQGEILYIIDKGVIIRDNKGNAIRMVGSMSNITEQKKLQLQLHEVNKSLQNHAKELERSNEELEQFAFIASHDLQEPLRMIASFMDLLQRKYSHQLDEKAHQYIHFATDGAKRMKQIILDLLDYSRANRPTESIESVNIQKVVKEFKQLRRKIIAEKNAHISATQLPIIYAYKAAISQIFHGILDNALKYAKPNTKPQINIEAIENENEWLFSIQDNGIGIEKQFFDKIFIIFQRLHNKDAFEGTGIGLSITKRHIEYMGGKIWLDSTPNEGTTFYFTIPKIKHDDQS